MASGGAVAAGAGYLRDAVGGLLQEAPGVFEADPVDVPARRDAGLRPEDAREVPGREPGAGGERLDGEVLAGVFGDPLLDLAQRLASGRLRGELGAELGLAARAPQEHDQMAGDDEGGLAAEVLLDEREGEVDAGGDARGGGDPAVAYVDGVGVGPHGRVVPGEPVAVRPVGGRAPAVQQARPGEQQRAGADGDQPVGTGTVRPQPVGEPGVRLPGARPARDEQGVRGGRLGEGAVGDEGQTAGGTDRHPVEGGGTDAVRAGTPGPGAREDLRGPGDVEALHPVEEDDQNGSHLLDSWRSPRWPQGRTSHLSCHLRAGLRAHRFPAYRPVGNLRA